MARGIDFGTAAAQTPLLASLRDPIEPLTYSSLYETFKRFVRRAVKHSALDEDQRRAAIKASLHWLRHTHVTRFAKRGGDLDVLQPTSGTPIRGLRPAPTGRRSNGNRRR